MSKDVNVMTRAEFEALPQRKWNENIGVFDSLIILPMRRHHDSGYRCMDFVAVRGHKAICRLSGCSDVLNIDGIGGYGKGWPEKYGGVPSLIPPVGWSVDCLPTSGLLRLFGECQQEVDIAISSFSVFSIPRTGKAKGQ